MRRALFALVSSGLITCAVIALVYWRMTHFDPGQILPNWYMLPLYAILRAIPDKIVGIFGAVGAIFGLAILPWLMASNPRSTIFRPIAVVCLFAFVLTVPILAVCGAHEPDSPVFGGGPGGQFLDADINSYIWLSRLFTAYYFIYIVVIVPLLRRWPSDDTAL
jgi:ubiquinol-cytochrome c reductase cytochrome b subunit